MSAASPVPISRPRPEHFGRFGGRRAGGDGFYTGLGPNQRPVWPRTISAEIRHSSLASSALQRRPDPAGRDHVTYYAYRYYDPLTGRWPSRDPIEEEGGLNLYGFVGNDGIGKWDSRGLAVFVVSAYTSGHDSIFTSGQITVSEEQRQSVRDFAKRVAREISDTKFSDLQSKGAVLFNNAPFKGSKNDYISKIEREANISRTENVSFGGVRSVAKKMDEYNRLATEEYDVLALSAHGFWENSNNARGWNSLGEVNIAGETVSNSDLLKIENLAEKPWIVSACFLHNSLQQEVPYIIPAMGAIKESAVGDVHIGNTMYVNALRCVVSVRFKTFGFDYDTKIESPLIHQF